MDGRWGCPGCGTRPRDHRPARAWSWPTPCSSARGTRSWATAASWSRAGTRTTTAGSTSPTSSTRRPRPGRTACPRWRRVAGIPTVTTLADGRVVTVAGRDSASNEVLVPEIWENGQWVRLPGASLTPPVLSAPVRCPERQALLRRRAHQVALSRRGRGQWGHAGQVEHVIGLQPRLSVQSRLRLGGDVRDGEGSLRRRGRRSQLEHARSQGQRPDRHGRDDRHQRRHAALDQHRIRCTLPGGT